MDPGREGEELSLVWWVRRLLGRARHQSKIKTAQIVHVNESMLDARNPKLREVSL